MDGDSPVLWRLAGVAIERMAKTSPTIVEIADEHSELVLPDLGWLRVQAEGAAGIAGVVQERLSGGPVMVGPLWQRISAEDTAATRLPGLTLLSEALLTEFRPAGRESVLGVVVPASTLTALSRRAMREAVEAHWRPAVVLYAEDAFCGIDHRFETGVLLLVPRERQWSTIIFRVPGNADPERVEEDFRGLLKRRKGVQRGQYGYVVKSPLPPGDSLLFDRHDPTVVDRRADLGGYGNTATLAELCETMALGIHFRASAESCQPGDDGAIRVLSGRDIRRANGILLPDEHSNWARVPSELQLRQGDIVLPRIFDTSQRKGLIAVEVALADLPAAAGDTVIWLRPRAELSREQRQFTLLYLQSELAQILASTFSASLRGGTMLTASG